MKYEGNSIKEKFVIDILDNKTNGIYVEVGAFNSKIDSNTYYLETQYNWKGLALEIEPRFQKEYTLNRKNDCILADGLTFNYLKYFEENSFPKQIDFLSVNMDDGYTDEGRSTNNPAQNLLGLIQIPLNLYRFTVIMFEHDALMDHHNNLIRDSQREILRSLGYSLVGRTPFEDWWVDPKIIKYPKYKNHFFYYGSP